jgi:choline dehydrogenase-like flavoprotein
MSISGRAHAEPPVGNLRFAPPETKANGEVINATAFTPVCMQQFSNSSTIYTAQVPQLLVNGGAFEDCLYLRIWAPALKTEYSQEQALPVFLYIPVGGFTSGGANSLYKIPDKWIQNTAQEYGIDESMRNDLSDEASRALNHGSGTCAVASVVDNECRVKGVDCLRVVDASIFPHPLGAHYQATGYAVAEQACSHFFVKLKGLTANRWHK